MYQIDEAAMDFVSFIPTGFVKGYQSWRNNLQAMARTVPGGVGRDQDLSRH